MGIVGQREVDSDAVAVRVRGAGNKQEVMPVGRFVERVTREIATRALVP